MWTPPPFRPTAPSRDRRAEKPPGRPPWAPRHRLTAPGAGMLILVATAAVGGLLSLAVAVWRLIDRATDLR